MRAQKKASTNLRYVSDRIHVSMLAVLVILVSSLGCAPLSDWWNQVKAKKTAGNMVNLGIALEWGQPKTTEVAAISETLNRGNFSNISLKDAWGNDLVISLEESQNDPTVRVYSIRSLGRNGKVGNCCQRSTRDWDDDALLVAGKWKQVWVWP